MKIDSIAGSYGPDRGAFPGRRGVRADAPESTERFSGPSTGAMIRKLQEMDPSRPDLVASVKAQVASGEYLTADKVRRVVEQLASLL